MWQNYRRTPMSKSDFNKVARQLKITFQHGRSPVNLLHIFRIRFLKNTSGRVLLLIACDIWIVWEKMKLLIDIWVWLTGWYWDCHILAGKVSASWTWAKSNKDIEIDTFLDLIVSVHSWPFDLYSDLPNYNSSKSYVWKKHFNKSSAASTRLCFAKE